MDLHEITDDEYRHYRQNLIPKLMRKRPAEWTRIDDIASDPARFVEIVECLASYRVFDNTQGYCMIDLNADASCIRVDPCALRFRNDLRYQWKYVRSK